MSTESSALIARRACVRCSTQKRRCDRVMPNCGLCQRLRQACNYESPPVSTSGLTSPPALQLETFPASGTFTPEYVRGTIIQKLGHIPPKNILSAYCREIEPWFPVISIARLRSQLPLKWDEASLDFALLCLSILLLTTTPRCSPEDDNDSFEFKSLYFSLKSIIASTEGLGINSLMIVQARTLVTLFEVVHGIYPAAYISIGATARAADAFEVYPGAVILPSSYHSDHEANQMESLLTWCGIAIIDRYIAVDSGPHPAVTRSRFQSIVDVLKPIMCPTHEPGQDRTSPVCRLARLLEASSLLEHIHLTLNSPTEEQSINTEELLLGIQTAISLQMLIKNEIGDEAELYAGGLGLCKIVLLLAFEPGGKGSFITGVDDDCSFVTTNSLVNVLTTITSMVEPFSLGAQSIDFNVLPPFVIFLVYKAAAIITESLLRNVRFNEGLEQLRILRKFLKVVGERWLGCNRYLKLLNEDTTPRLLKAVEQE